MAIPTSRIWTNATITPLERPAALAGKATPPTPRRSQFEKKSADDPVATDGQSEGLLLAAAGFPGTGACNMLFIDRGSEFARNGRNFVDCRSARCKISH